jgi:hypothetical protein
MTGGRVDHWLTAAPLEVALKLTGGHRRRANAGANLQAGPLRLFFGDARTVTLSAMQDPASQGTGERRASAVTNRQARLLHFGDARSGESRQRIDDAPTR